MSILIVVRHTRAEEETGRAELVGAGVVGRHAPLAAALLAAAIADVALGVVVAARPWSPPGLGRHRRARARAAFAAVGLVFAAVAAVAAQVAESARGANGLAVAVLGGAFGLRAIGDAGPHWLSWLSPLGWGQRCARSPASAGGCCCCCSRSPRCSSCAAVALAARRDLGAGLLPPRPGPAARVAAHAAGARLAPAARRAAGWAAGFAILGAAFGSIAQDIGDVIGDSPDVLDALRAARRRARASSTPTWRRRCRSSR